MKFSSEFFKLRRLSPFSLSKRCQRHAKDAFPYLKQYPILGNPQITVVKNLFLAYLFLTIIFLTVSFLYVADEALAKGRIVAAPNKEFRGKEEKRLTLDKSDGRGVTHLRQGQSRTSQNKITEYYGMVLIPAGKFVYGEPRSQKTKVLKSYYMDANEVTQKDYEQVMGKNPSKFKGENLPVEKVTWQEAKEYCRLKGKRLPTSMEWEKAARAGTTSKYYWGNTLGKNKANCNDCGSQWDGLKTAPVRSFPPNALGLFDMAGNVWEWVDQTHNKKLKVLRGGSWMDDSSFIPSAAPYFVSPRK